MENFLVLSTMELPFVGGNGVVKMSKIQVCFLWYHICFKSMRRWLVPYLLFKRALRNVQLSLT